MISFFFLKFNKAKLPLKFITEVTNRSKLKAKVVSPWMISAPRNLKNHYSNCSNLNTVCMNTAEIILMFLFDLCASF